MTKTRTTKRAPTGKAQRAGSFLDQAGQQTPRRFRTAVIGSLLVHVLVFGVWFSTAMVQEPEILEIREISFVDENETPPVEEEPEVPVGNGKSRTLTVPGGDTDDDEAPMRREEVIPGNTVAESRSGAINAERAEKEVNVNKIGVLGLLDGVAENGSAENALALNMQTADGVVQGLKMNRSLTVGKGNNPKGEVEDGALFAASRNGQGINDLLDVDIDAGEGVALQKGGRVQFTGFGGTGGTGGAYGARSEVSLYAVLQKNLGRLQYIYEKHLRQNPTIGGKVEVEVIIRSDGTVGKITILSSQIPLPAFQEELKAAIQRWRYDAIDEGRVRVVYPLVFIKVG
ncbi:MAG: TonB family protein [bacterium]